LQLFPDLYAETAASDSVLLAWSLFYICEWAQQDIDWTHTRTLLKQAWFRTVDHFHKAQSMHICEDQEHGL